MTIINPFDLIISKIDVLQACVNGLRENNKKPIVIQPEDPDRLLNLAEAANVLRKPVGTVRYYIHQKSLPAIKVGKGYVVKHSALMAWVDEFKVSTDENPVINMRRRFAKR
ncbi:helix-turn-helix domain-containing protein [Chitinophaga sp. Cy-1792]|uniref:helix-turn-helix domain-containing protein n=1 Tax=Chitinophaga sp. Cy-1792 TaxID=2608339 RepID=UPI00141FC5EF|nr:helix-turn-helix domain-containing protein [Chitinophaga sp. Cy-1792]NIG52505.1 helix-turn-helix domain-containing protein [Chitinophaga sp. Cy-1792]